MSRPDQSFFLAHFTKNGKNYNGSKGPHDDVNEMSALERLISILKDRKITAFELPWINRKAVCFTECPWGSLLRHAKSYSPYGIGFTKKLVYSRNGNPVIYANPDLFQAEKWDERVYPFITPFVPTYASDKVKGKRPFNGKAVDYTHEREWRVAKDFPFRYSYIAFVVLNSYTEMEQIPSEIVEAIGKDKFIFMDTYRKIETLWPTHLME
mgnify:FL=1